MRKIANLNIRVDPQLKKEAEAVYAEFGMSLSEAVTIFLHKTLMTGGLPFEVKKPKLNTVTLAAMQEAEDIVSGKIQAKGYASAKELSLELDAKTTGEC
ncbi:MAG: type II toxin-antitoxin system RelB/DinJ family antitoxin [Treponema sp.]|jgi:DNA-damage-inducible protein J|nr:type II toxin-antitoxin system RelB/DinJ family antitoxin [Treponema sp.]